MQNKGSISKGKTEQKTFNRPCKVEILQRKLPFRHLTDAYLPERN